MNSCELNLRKSFLEIINEHKQFFKPHSQNLDVDDRHDLRVMLRRIDAMLKLMKDYLPRIHYQRIRNVLNKVLKRLGKVRDRDVLYEGSKTFHLDLDVDFQKNVPLKKFISKKEFNELEEELSWIQNRMGEMTEISLKERMVLLQEKLTRWQKQKKFTHKELHQFRIFMKQIRYSLEALSFPVNRMKSLQNHLGKFHDLQNLQSYALDPRIENSKKAEHQKILRKKDDVAKMAQKRIEKVLKSL